MPLHSSLRGIRRWLLFFKKAGYATAAIGKWHLGLGDRGGIDWNKPIAHTPNDIGFDESFIMPATSDRVPCVYLRNGGVLNLSPDDPLEVNYQHIARCRKGCAMCWQC